MLSEEHTPSSHVQDPLDSFSYEGWQRWMWCPHLPPFRIYSSGVGKGMWVTNLNLIHSEFGCTEGGNGSDAAFLLFQTADWFFSAFLRTRLFTIYFTISTQAISLSPPSGEYFSLFFTFHLFSECRQPKHLQHLIQIILWRVCCASFTCVCVYVRVCASVYIWAQGINVMSGSHVFLIRNQLVRQQLQA